MEIRKRRILTDHFTVAKVGFDVLKDKIPMILKYFPNMTFRATIHRPTAKIRFII